jgi:hypothetical protein
MIFVHVTFANGAIFRRNFKTYSDALAYCRNNISYSGGRIARVDINGTQEGNGLRAVWDSTWNPESQRLVFAI